MTIRRYCQFSFIAMLLLLSGCSKYYLIVKRESVDREVLASTFVRSPDPRQKNPPVGEELAFEWRLHPDALNQPLKLVVHILYRNHEEKRLVYPVQKRRGVRTFSLLNQEYCDSKGFLTYKAEIVTEEGKVIEKWEQQLWTHLITVDESELE